MDNRSNPYEIALSVWTKRLAYANETRDHKWIAECEHAVADLRKKIAAVAT